MNILYFIHGLSTGGAEKVAARLTLIWSELGHRVFLVTETPEENSEYSHQCYAREQIRFCDITKECLRRIRDRYKFDAVVFNDTINYKALPQVLNAVSEFPEVRSVMLVHHTANNWLYTTGYPLDVARDELLSKIDVMISVDPLWTLWWHHRGCRSHYIPNPVALECGPNEASGQGLPSKAMIWVGRADDFAKQPELAIDVFAEVFLRHHDASLLMLGSKNSALEHGLRARLSSKLRKLGAGEDVVSRAHQCFEMPGFVPNAGDYMRSACTHVFTSLTEVTVPQVVLEAQACGLPTVTLDLPVLQGQKGVIMCKDVKAMSDAVVDLLSYSDYRSKIAQEAMVGAQERRIGNDVAALWKELFDNLLDKRQLQAIVTRHQDTWQSLKIYSSLLEEIHRSHKYFVVKYLPQLLKYRRFIKRLDVKYLWQRLKDKVK